MANNLNIPQSGPSSSSNDQMDSIPISIISFNDNTVKTPPPIIKLKKNSSLRDSSLRIKFTNRRLSTSFCNNGTTTANDDNLSPTKSELSSSSFRSCASRKPSKVTIKKENSFQRPKSLNSSFLRRKCREYEGNLYC